MYKSLKIFVSLITFLTVQGQETINFNEILNFCCTQGDHWAIYEKNCREFELKSSDLYIPPGLIHVCLSTAEICCSRQHRDNQCIAGQNAAKNGLICEQNDIFDTEFFRDCCESCKIGLVIADSVDRCSLAPFSFGTPWDEVYELCCNESKNPDSFILSNEDEKNICDRFDRLCSQLCENTDNSYVCKCHPGYQLIEDKITCVPDKLANENEINSNVTITSKPADKLPSVLTGCPTGYGINLINGNCIDINECENGDADCNTDTQVCVNKNGGYNCFDILTSNSECSDGYRFNVKSELCDDINECLEELHDCNKKTQICLNTRGSFICQNKMIEECLPGFSYDEHTKSCQDIDECLNSESCYENFLCVNTQGNYDCIPIKPQNVRPSLTTLVTQPKRTSCAVGFRRHLNKCIDIDECATDQNACDSNQICTNVLGGFRCDCRIGFSLDPVTNACVDVNECQINNHECLESQRCDNTIGSYTCIRLQSCGTGYTLNAETGNCDDDDECLLGSHNCLAPYECRNTKGSFRCDKMYQTIITTPPPTTLRTTRTTTTLLPLSTLAVQTTSSSNFGNIIQPFSTIPTFTPFEPYSSLPQNQKYGAYNRYYQPCQNGFERNTQGACTDIDECQLGRPCRSDQRCVNTNGSYRCQTLLSCSGGYVSNDEGTQCIDIDECSTGQANCGPDQICRNKPGGYLCYCPPGHILSHNKRCEDINECEYSRDQVCPSNSECLNFVGSYRCECKNGFKKLYDDKNCVDVDECNDSPGLCQQKCINYWGSYKCSCNSGYRISENNRTCDDIDECIVHKSYNLCMGTCENTPGSYQCTCPPGYRLGTDLRSCQDIDECETEPICRGYNEICTNIRGSYRCNRIDCPPDYSIDPDKKNRCKRNSLICDHDDIDCFRRPSSYSYNYITLTSNMIVPPIGRALFNLRGPNSYGHIEFDLKIVNVSAPTNVRKANEHYFSMHKMHNEVLLSLMLTLEGPQDIELELRMTVFRHGQPSGSNVAKIFIIVAEYNF